jgi:hypothetical protein
MLPELLNFVSIIDLTVCKGGDGWKLAGVGRGGGDVYYIPYDS